MGWPKVATAKNSPSSASAAGAGSPRTGEAPRVVGHGGRRPLLGRVAELPLRNGGGLVDAPCRRVVGAKREYPLCAAYLLPRTDRRRPYSLRADPGITRGTRAAGTGRRTREASGFPFRDDERAPREAAGRSAGSASIGGRSLGLGYALASTDLLLASFIPSHRPRAARSPRG